MFTKNFSQLKKGDTAIAGGKGASLGEMTQVGIPVPPGFVVITDAFERFIKETDLIQEIRHELNQVDNEKIHTAENASEKIQALILNKKMPEDIENEIKVDFKKLDAKFVAVRSSATAEDGLDHAWAGQLDSFLNVTEENLLKSVQKCWASLFTPRAIFYRFEKGLQNTDVSVAVVVQKMVNSDKSGIAFSVHPVTEERNQILIEAGLGLGEAIVSGQITPDAYVVGKKVYPVGDSPSGDNDIIDININEQSKALYRKPGGGNKWKDLSEDGKKQVLSEDEILELSEIIKKIEDHYGLPQDIEWAQEGGKFYITQSRPITTLKDNTKKQDNPLEREVVVSHKSEYLTQDLILRGIFQYCKFRDFGTTFNFPLIRYEHSTGNISYPVKQLDELRGLRLDEDDFKRMINKLDEEISEYKKYLKKFKEQIKSGNDKENKILDYFDKTLKAVSVVPYFAFEMSLSNLLEENGVSQNEIPSTATYASRSSEELKKLAHKYKEELSKREKNIPRDLKEDLKTFCSKFGYLGMKYFGGEAWSIDSTYELLFELKDQKNDTPKKFDKKNISPYAKIASDLLYLRTQNWESMCYGCYLFKKFIKEHFSEELSYEKILQLSIDDLLAIIQKKKVLGEKQISNKNFILEIKNEGVFSFKESNNKKKEEIIKYEGGGLMGVSAREGKVSGVAKIVLDPKECKKVNVGDVLVATMSTPDFLPAMHKASAFVTDIGGITSHAAIVSRELGKPCIIGTKIATQVLKDGDEVEVDADNGVVKILKRKEEDNTNVLDFVKNNKLHKQFVYSFIPIICFESANYCYIKNPLKEKLGIKKFPSFVVIWKDNYEDWGSNRIEKIRDIEKINLIIDENRKIVKKYEKSVSVLLEADYSKLKSNELIKILRDIDSMSVEIYYYYIFLIHDYIETEDAELIKLLPEVRIEMSEFVDKIYKCCDYIIDTLAERFDKIKWETFMYATFDEIIGLLENPETINEFKSIYKRPIAFIFDGKEVSTIKKKEDVLEIVSVLKKNVDKIENIDEISGNVAFKGKAKGIVVKVSELYYEKVNEVLDGKKDYILVTPMTRPEFVPFMKNSSAIITDEGGVTCHAAIVSRELKIPCIIGTKIATQVLSDGDEVEVNADSGVVKILKRINEIN